MKRYVNTLNTHEKMVIDDFEEKFDYDAPYVVDDSNFVPMSEAVRQLGSGAVDNSIVDQYYDFPTGKDTGESVPFSRTKECNDIAVLSSKISEDTAELADKISKNKAENAKREAFEAELKSASVQNSTDTSATPKE